MQRAPAAVCQAAGALAAPRLPASRSGRRSLDAARAAAPAKKKCKKRKGLS
jgi:hypothetical protein